MVKIRYLQSADVKFIEAAFDDIGWNKPASQMDGYLQEQEAGKRVVFIAFSNGIFAGYVTILWESVYEPFLEAEIPEVVDFNVLPKFQRKGIGTKLMDAAEKRVAKRSSIVGIGVGLTSDYGAAQNLYIQRGYIVDGRGISWKGKLCQYGDQVIVDDGLALYFTKQLE
jgi:GNAT superfamily N-acetyltransferase